MKTCSVLLAFTLVGVCLGADQEPASTTQGKEPGYDGKTVSEWAALTKDNSPIVREQAFLALAMMGADAKAAMPVLMESLQDDDPKIRRYSATALGEIGREAKAAIPALTKLLKDENSEVRWAAAHAVGNMGPEAKVAVPTLTKLLKDEDLDSPVDVCRGPGGDRARGKNSHPRPHRIAQGQGSSGSEGCC